MLTHKEILLILKLLQDKYGPGYAENKEVSALQAKLSIMLELAEK
jgi:hypothetical protein